MTFLHSGVRGLEVCCTALLYYDRSILPVSLALIEHLNLTKNTVAAVTWPFLDDLEHNVLV